MAKNICTLFSQSIKGETALLETLREAPIRSGDLLDACKGEVQEYSDNSQDESDDVSEPEDVINRRQLK